MCSTVSNVISSTFRGEGLAGVGADQLVEDRALARSGPKNPAEPLHVFADAARARNDDRDLRVGDVDALVEQVVR